MKKIILFASLLSLLASCTCHKQVSTKKCCKQTEKCTSHHTKICKPSEGGKCCK